MEILTQFIDIVLHLDKHLAVMVQQYGLWIYGILFFVPVEHGTAVLLMPSDDQHRYVAVELLISPRGLFALTPVRRT